MKKIFFALAAAALVAVSCNKEGGDDNKVKPLEATLELTTSVATDVVSSRVASSGFTLLSSPPSLLHDTATNAAAASAKKIFFIKF